MSRDNVIHVNFPQAKRSKRRGLALTFGAGEGRVYIAARLKQWLTVKQAEALVEDLQEVIADAKERRNGG